MIREKHDGLSKVAFLGDYLPRKCGIAAFTTELNCAGAGPFPNIRSPVAPLNDVEDGYDYPPEMRFESAEQDLPSGSRCISTQSDHHSDYQ
jgi:hypothetical protein